MNTAATKSTAAMIAPAFRAGVAIAAAQLEGAANDGRPVAFARDLIDDRSGVFYISRSRALTAPAIIDALDGACDAYASTRDSSVTVYAAEALAAPLHATGTHSGSRAGRLAVRCISATLRACGVEVIG
jgi:hypothetical protein